MVANIFDILKKRLKNNKILPDNQSTEDRIINEVIVHDHNLGSTGIQNFSGYIQEEYLEDLRGRDRADMFDKMRRSCYQVAMCLNAVKNPIKSAVWEIEPGDDSPEAEKDAEFIKFILFQDLNKPFKDILSEALTTVEFGHSVFEITHKVGAKHPEFKNYTGIAALSWRSPRTIERWNIDSIDEHLVSITQFAFGDAGQVVDIPSEFLLLFNIGQEGANYEGISALRPCYGNWWRKNLYLKMNAAGIEKYAISTPTVEVPAGKENSPELTKLKNALSQFTSHQSSYLTYPAGWKLDLKANSGFDPSKVDTSIDSEDKRMSKAFLTNFLELGLSGTGAYALSNDLSDFFLSGIEHIAFKIESPFNQILIPSVVKLNFGPRKVYPKLKHSGLSDKAGKELAEIFTNLVNSKVIIPDDVLEDHVRKRFNFPERSLEGQRFNQPPAIAPQDGNQFIEKFKRVGICRK